MEQTQVIAQILNNGAKLLATAQSDEFVSICLTQVTNHYSSPTTPAADADSPGCATLAQWALGQLGVNFPWDGAFQYRAIHSAGLACTVTQAMVVGGALLFTKGSPRTQTYKVSISLGSGCGVISTIGNTATVVRKPDASAWHLAGFIPGLTYYGFKISNPLYADPEGTNVYAPRS